MVKINSSYILILALVLLLSCFLNFYHLKERSLLDWDEAYYMNIVKTWRSGADWFVYKIFAPAKIIGQSFSVYVLEHGGAINTFSKDGFLALVFLSSYLIGIRDITSLWVSAVFGVLTIWLLYLIARGIFGRTGGVLSSGILAVSVFHLHYARSGFPQATAVFFFYLAVFLYLESVRLTQRVTSNNRFLFFSGLSLGYAVSCHYNLIWSIPLFLLWETLNKAALGKELLFKGLIRRIFRLSLGILIPVLFWGTISEITKFFLYRSPAAIEAIRGSLGAGDYAPFFQRLIEVIVPFFKVMQKAGIPKAAICSFDPLFYIKLLMLWEGPAILAFLTIGVLRLAYRQIRRFELSEFVVLSLFLVPFFYLSFSSRQLARSFPPAIPAMALIIGGLLSRGIEKASRNDAVRLGAVFIILLFFIFQARSRIGVELSYVSGYPAAIEFMSKHSGQKHLSSQFTISRFFVGRKNALDISVTFENVDAVGKLKELQNKEGYRYLLLDQMRYAFRDSPIAKAATRSDPVFSTRHSTDANLFENNIAGFTDAVRRAPKILEVYELADILRNLE